MEANSTDRKTFQLTKDGHLAGELIYENLFRFTAEITLDNSESYHIRPVGFFGTSISVTKDESEVVNLKMNWRGQIVFSFQDGREFVLKSKGFFNNVFTLENSDELMLIQFAPRFDWSKFNYNYSISYEEKTPDILLTILGVYACNYLITAMSGSM